MLLVIRQPFLLRVVLSCLYAAGCIAFGIFYGKQEGSTVGYLKGFGVSLLLLILGTWSVLGVGGMVASTFYVADRKNRSRMWAFLAVLIGPIALLILVLLPRFPETPSLSLT